MVPFRLRSWRKGKTGSARRLTYCPRCPFSFVSGPGEIRPPQRLQGGGHSRTSLAHKLQSGQQHSAPNATGASSGRGAAAVTPPGWLAAQDTTLSPRQFRGDHNAIPQLLPQTCGHPPGTLGPLQETEKQLKSLSHALAVGQRPSLLEGGLPFRKRLWVCQLAQGWGVAMGLWEATFLARMNTKAILSNLLSRRGRTELQARKFFHILLSTYLFLPLSPVTFPSQPQSHGPLHFLMPLPSPWTSNTSRLCLNFCLNKSYSSQDPQVKCHFWSANRHERTPITPQTCAGTVATERAGFLPPEAKDRGF